MGVDSRRPHARKASTEWKKSRSEDIALRLIWGPRKQQLKLEAFDQARPSVDEAIRLNPHLPGVYTLSGIIMYSPEITRGRRQTFRRHSKPTPMTFRPNCYSAPFCTPKENLDTAGLHLAAHSKSAPRSPLALYEMARVKRAQGQIDAAVKDLEKVVRAEPEWIPPHVELAALYYRLKRPEDGAREKQIVDRLSEEHRQRQSKPRRHQSADSLTLSTRSPATFRSVWTMPEGQRISTC